ncbi:phage holin family protein [Neogemmobacter tilapiae]|uniref:Phage holin family protein n=1 Tax=Neogemmobacter tilapiae TaxID=875041 RepID=A0A918WLQ4_9RHOB|nr:phage holin family protein [Gemmobacter tilapiae]GHC54669.1 hypothetical protein GCM10007315_17040 [Gemmobacter tilapiae]
MNPLNDVLASLSRLIRGELALARTEAEEAARRAGQGVVHLLVALVAGMVALNVLAGAAVAGVAALGVGPHWAALIVGVVLALIALGYAQYGLSMLKIRSPFRRAGRGLRRDVETLKQAGGDNAHA